MLDHVTNIFNMYSNCDLKKCFLYISNYLIFNLNNLFNKLFDCYFGITVFIHVLIKCVLELFCKILQLKIYKRSRIEQRYLDIINVLLSNNNYNCLIGLLTIF